MKEVLRSQIDSTEVCAMIMANPDAVITAELPLGDWVTLSTLRKLINIGCTFFVAEEKEEEVVLPLSEPEPVKEDCTPDPEEDAKADFEEEQMATAEGIENLCKKFKVRQNSSGGRRRDDLDEGKIKSLYDAGWTIKAIAEDMNASATAITSRLRKMGLAR